MTVWSPTGVVFVSFVSLVVALTAWVVPATPPVSLSRPLVRYMLAMTSGLGGVGVGWYLSAPTVAVVIPLTSAIVVAEYNRRAEAFVSVEIDRQLPLLIEGMIQRLRSGSGLHGVCLQPPAVGAEVDVMTVPMSQALANGTALRVAVSRFGIADGSQPFSPDDARHLVATALTVAATHGGPVAPALQRLRLTLTARARARADGRARASQGLASARLLVAAPAVFAVLLATFDSRLGHLYLHEPIGAVCVSICIALSYGGWRWMHNLVDGLMPTVSSDTCAGRDQ